MAEEEKSVPEKNSNGTTKEAPQKSYPVSNKGLLIGLLIAVVIVILLFFTLTFGFFGHYRYNYPNMMRGNDGRGYMMGPGYKGFGGNGYGMMGQNVIRGKVTNVSGQTFTMDVSGTSKNVQINDTTRFPVSSSSSVKNGDTVLVWGLQDSKGVIQATYIQINP